MDLARVSAIPDSPRLNNLCGGALFPVVSGRSTITGTSGGRQIKVNCADTTHILDFAQAEKQRRKS
jgi:hypothetical protein